MTDVAAFASWRAAVSGETVPMHADEPWCGYFKIRDRRGLNLNKAPIKRPWIACAIWRDAAGDLKAEIAGRPVPVDHVWPWCAKHPIPYEQYAFWHQHERWPEPEEVE